MEQEGKKDNMYGMTDEERATLMRKRALPPIKEEVKEEEEPEFENMFIQMCCMSNRKKNL